MKNAKIQSGVIDIGDASRKGLLFHPDISSEYKYEWVLIPVIGSSNFSGIQSYIKCEIELGNCALNLSPSPMAK
jgi:hypothetical protein